MKDILTFENFWLKYGNRPMSERCDYFNSLSRRDQSLLKQSFFEDRWCDIVVQNIMDKRLDFVKRHYGIDLIMMRLQALKEGRVFLVPKNVWLRIHQLFHEFDRYYDPGIIFGGLTAELWGKEDRFYSIKADRKRRKNGQKTK